MLLVLYSVDLLHQCREIPARCLWNRALGTEVGNFMTHNKLKINGTSTKVPKTGCGASPSEADTQLLRARWDETLVNIVKTLHRMK